MTKESEIRLTKLSKCAGCGAKVGAGTLSELLGGMPTHHDENLLVGYDRSDDACVYRVSDEIAVVETVDFFPPIVDDPYLYGQIAAANALSDVYAMGGEPRFALNLLCVPQDMPAETVQAILAGGYDKVYEAGAVIAGGHSIYSDEPKYGMAVTGFLHPDRVLKNVGARPGDVLILTKPLGAGILTTGRKADMVTDGVYGRATKTMATLNKAARDGMIKYRVHACTDVTGFSLLGHLTEMMLGSDTMARLDTGRIDIPREALELAEIGILPEGVYRNRSFAEQYVDVGSVPLKVQDALFDPQTSGGLLISVDAADADALMDELAGKVPSVQRIGTVGAHHEGPVRIILQ